MFCQSNTTEPKVYMYIAVAYIFLPKSVDPPLGDAVDMQMRQTVRTSREAQAGFFLIYAAHVIKPTVRSQQPISQTISCNGFRSMSSYPFIGSHRQSRFLCRQLLQTPNFFLYTQFRHHQGRGKKWPGPTPSNGIYFSAQFVIWMPETVDKSSAPAYCKTPPLCLHQNPYCTRREPMSKVMRAV